MVIMREAPDCGLAFGSDAGDSLLKSPHAVTRRAEASTHNPVCAVHLIFMVRLLLNRQIPRRHVQTERERLRSRRAHGRTRFATLYVDETSNIALPLQAVSSGHPR